MHARALLIPILAIGILTFLSPSAHAKGDFKLGGRIGLGFAVDEEDGTDDVFEMRLAMKTKRQEDGLKAYVEMKAEDGSREIDVHDAFADWRDPGERSRVRFGRGKKIMGWEYEYSTAERLGIGRSAAYRFLSERALVGRDYFVSYDWFDRSVEAAKESDDADVEERESLDSLIASPGDLVPANEHWKLGIAAHYDESKDLGLIVNAITSLSDDVRVGAWLSRQRTRTAHTGIYTHQATLSTMFQHGAHRGAIELFAGEDPTRTLAERRMGGERTIRFGAAKAEYGLYFGRWNPYAILTRLQRDLRHFHDRTIEVTGGLRIFLSKRLSLAGEATSTTSRSTFDPTVAPFDRTSGNIIARYYF
jgi:hypothetical protein